MKKVLFGFLLFFVLGAGIVFGQTLQNKTLTEWHPIEKFNNLVYSEMASQAKQLIGFKQDVEKEIDIVVQNLLHHQVEQTRASIELYLTDAIELLNETVVSLQSEYGNNSPKTSELFVEDFDTEIEEIWNPNNRAYFE